MERGPIIAGEFETVPHAAPAGTPRDWAPRLASFRAGFGIRRNQNRHATGSRMAEGEPPLDAVTISQDWRRRGNRQSERSPRDGHLSDRSIRERSGAESTFCQPTVRCPDKTPDL
jgi:hypothetical protein